MLQTILVRAQLRSSGLLTTFFAHKAICENGGGSKLSATDFLVIAAASNGTSKAVTILGVEPVDLVGTHVDYVEVLRPAV